MYWRRGKGTSAGDQEVPKGRAKASSTQQGHGAKTTRAAARAGLLGGRPVGVTGSTRWVSESSSRTLCKHRPSLAPSQGFVFRVLSVHLRFAEAVGFRSCLGCVGGRVRVLCVCLSFPLSRLGERDAMGTRERTQSPEPRRAKQRQRDV